MTDRRSPKVSVTDGPSPSAALIAAAAAEVTVTDGPRTFTLRKPGILGQVNLIKVLGDLAKNDLLRDIYAPLTYIHKIDGEIIPQPENMLQLDALLAKVEEGGIVAVMGGVVEHYGVADSKGRQDTVKN